MTRNNRSKDLWKNLAVDLESAVSPDPDDGIWSQITIKPGGVWKEANQETILLNRKGTQQGGIWEQSAEETLFLDRNRSVNIWTSVEEQAGEQFIPGDHHIWKELEDQTQIIKRSPTVLWQSPKIRDIGKLEPMRAVGWAIKKIDSAKGESYWVLKNLRKDAYLKLSEEQVFIWELMDGSHTMQDIAVSVFIKFNTLSFESLIGFVEHLYANGFLVTEKVDVYQSVGQKLSRNHPIMILKRIGQFFMRSEFSLKGVDEFFSRMYKLGGKIFFSRIAIILMVLICLLGIPAFLYVTQLGEYSFLRGASDSLSLGVIGIFLTQAFAVFTHESSHALTTKHFGRTVKRGGVGLYIGMIAFFVDTTDIWMEPRKSRLAVTWAGPFSGFLLGSIASIPLVFLPISTGAGIAYQFATFCFYMSLVNLNPLLRLDGYFLLMDWLEMPQLRKRSIAFVRKELLAKLRKREKLSREERIYSIFGVLSLAWTVIFVVFSIHLFGSRLVAFSTTLISYIQMMIEFLQDIVLL